MLKQCRDNRRVPCFACDKDNYCHALQNTIFKNKSCPFYLTYNQMMKDLKHCADRLNLSFDYYKRSISYLYDKYERKQ